MSTRSADFNYKVALASGLRSLQGGRLRQAEEQFRYLVRHFPAADGGYRGLAKVLVEQEDRPAALRTLVDGGAQLAKAGQRAGAIALYREAMTLDPLDLTAHRRLAAALTLAGEATEAAQEYVRYIQYALGSGDGERARLEAAYALERLPDQPEVADIARQVGIDVAAVLAARPPRREAAPPPVAAPAQAAATREALMRSAFGAAPSREPAAEPPATPSSRAPAPFADAADPWGARTEPLAPPFAAPAPGASDGEPLGADADSSAVEAAAARYLAKGDPRGGATALEAARRYIADGRTDAASDILLQLIAGGVANHDAQRLLVDVVRTLGKPEVARTKCQLLVQALRLDGRDDLAAEVEQLAQGE